MLKNQKWVEGRMRDGWTLAIVNGRRRWYRDWNATPICSVGGREIWFVGDHVIVARRIPMHKCGLPYYLEGRLAGDDVRRYAVGQVRAAYAAAKRS